MQGIAVLGMPVPADLPSRTEITALVGFRTKFGRSNAADRAEGNLPPRDVCNINNIYFVRNLGQRNGIRLLGRMLFSSWSKIFGIFLSQFI